MAKVRASHDDFRRRLARSTEQFMASLNRGQYQRLAAQGAKRPKRDTSASEAACYAERTVHCYPRHVAGKGTQAGARDAAQSRPSKTAYQGRRARDDASP